MTVEEIKALLGEGSKLTFNGSWANIKEGLIEAGKIIKTDGGKYIAQFTSAAGAAGATATSAVKGWATFTVSEVTTAAGAIVTELSPSAVVTGSVPQVAVCSIAGALGLDIGAKVGYNFVLNGFDLSKWDWKKTGLEVIGDAITTYIDKDGKTYYDSKTIDSIKNRLIELGAYSDGGITIPEYTTLPTYTDIPTIPVKSLLLAMYEKDTELNYEPPFAKYAHIKKGIENILKDYVVINSGGLSSIRYFASGENGVVRIESNQSPQTFQPLNVSQYFNLHLGLYKGKYDVYRTLFITPTTSKSLAQEFSINSRGEITNMSISETNNSITMTINTGSVYLNIGTIGQEAPEGVTKQEGATYPSADASVLDTYSDGWGAKGIPMEKEEGVSISLPVGVTDVNPEGLIITQPQVEAQEGVTDIPIAEEIAETSTPIIEAITDEPVVPTIPTNPIGVIDIPPFVPASDSASDTGFVKIYNPTKNQLVSFNRFLWSKGFIDTIEKLNMSPFQAVIGLSAIYVTPEIDATTSNIICGYVDSNVPSFTVNNQYTDWDCGNITIREYFRDARDYNSTTNIQIYLPFIGIQNLAASDVMNKTINVYYRVDVLTGACVAFIRCDDQLLYQFSGNMSVQIPITSGTYSENLRNIQMAVSTGGGFIAGAKLGSALGPVGTIAGGIAGGLIGGISAGASGVGGQQIQRSGTLSGNIGVMSPRIPYLIITRQVPYDAYDYNTFYGQPSNKTVKLSSCIGFTKIRDVHLDNIPATDSELNELDEILKNGIII